MAEQHYTVHLGKIQLQIFSVQYTYYHIYNISESYWFCLALSTRSCPARLLPDAALWSCPSMLHVVIGKFSHKFSVYSIHIYSITELYWFCLATSTRSCPAKLLLDAASWSHPSMFLHIKVRLGYKFFSVQYTVIVTTFIADQLRHSVRMFLQNSLGILLLYLSQISSSNLLVCLLQNSLSILLLYLSQSGSSNLLVCLQQSVIIFIANQLRLSVSIFFAN